MFLKKMIFLSTTIAKISNEPNYKTYRSIVHESLIYSQNIDISHLLKLEKKSFNTAVQCR